jgi:hypothetical protein
MPGCRFALEECVLTGDDETKKRNALQCTFSSPCNQTVSARYQDNAPHFSDKGALQQSEVPPAADTAWFFKRLRFYKRAGMCGAEIKTCNRNPF